MTIKIKKPDENSKEEEFITGYDLHLLAQGTHYRIFEKLGSHLTFNNGLKGVNFAVLDGSVKMVKESPRNEFK